MTEQDEYEQEKRERRQRKFLDLKFKEFCNKSEDLAQKYKVLDFKFDIPYTDLVFMGCHGKANVNIYPTQTSLVALHEPPFFVFDVNDIELCHFERVNMGIKNFDFVLVYKDFANFKRVSSVPMEFLDVIKDWMDESGVLFSEGPMSLNWTNLLTQIRGDIGSFIDQGGWSFLQNFGSADEDDQESDLGSDSNFDDSEENKSQSSESDFSDASEKKTDSECDESSDVATDSNES